MHRRPITMLLVLGVSALALGVSGCSAFEKICNPGEVVVFYAGGGSGCEEPQDGDRECANGEILVKVVQTERDYCIENDYDDGAWKESIPTT